MGNDFAVTSQWGKISDIKATASEAAGMGKILSVKPDKAEPDMKRRKLKTTIFSTHL